MEPTLGFRDHVTAVLPPPPVTVALNCWLWPGNSETVIGERETLTELRKLIVAVRVLWFNVAVTVALWLLDMVFARAVKLALVLPDVTVTDVGTLSRALLLERDTTEPDLEAGRDNVTVHVAADPEATVAGLQPRVLTDRGVAAIRKRLGINMRQMRVQRVCLRISVVFRSVKMRHSYSGLSGTSVRVL